MTDAPNSETVIVVDDDEPVREALAMLLTAAGFEVCTHASGRELLEADPPSGPACLLLDLNMPGLDGIQVQKQLHSIGWDIPIIFLTGQADVSAAVRALKSGAMDFLEKNDFDRQTLLERVRHALDRHRDVLEQKAEAERFRERVGRLSQRELEVAHLAATGLANKVIGMQLGISERTVEVHRGRAMKKLGLRTMADLVRMEEQLEQAMN